MNEDHVNQVSVNFEVKKYVLPKFEVTIDHYGKLRVDESKFNVTVCARYTYGKNVQGKFELTAYTKKFSYKTYKEELFKKVVKTEEKVRVY